MLDFEEYMTQDSYLSETCGHYDEHTDRWVDEGHLPHGYSGHCDVHTDEG